MDEKEVITHETTSHDENADWCCKNCERKRLAKRRLAHALELRKETEVLKVMEARMKDRKAGIEAELADARAKLAKMEAEEAVWRPSVASLQSPPPPPMPQAPPRKPRRKGKAKSKQCNPHHSPCALMMEERRRLARQANLERGARTRFQPLTNDFLIEIADHLILPDGGGNGVWELGMLHFEEWKSHVPDTERGVLVFVLEEGAPTEGGKAILDSDKPLEYAWVPDSPIMRACYADSAPHFLRMLDTYNPADSILTQCTKRGVSSTFHNNTRKFIANVCAIVSLCSERQRQLLSGIGKANKAAELKQMTKRVVKSTESAAANLAKLISYVEGSQFD